MGVDKLPSQEVDKEAADRKKQADADRAESEAVRVTKEAADREKQADESEEGKKDMDIYGSANGKKESAVSKLWELSDTIDSVTRRLEAVEKMNRSRRTAAEAQQKKRKWLFQLATIVVFLIVCFLYCFR